MNLEEGSFRNAIVVCWDNIPNGSKGIKVKTWARGLDFANIQLLAEAQYKGRHFL